MSDISERSCPFADRLAIDIIGTRAANNCSKWVCALVECEISELERAPQKSIGPPPHSVMLNDCEDGIQVLVHRIARATCLKILPGNPDLFEPSPKPSFCSLAFSSAMWPTDRCWHRYCFRYQWQSRVWTHMLIIRRPHRLADFCRNELARRACRLQLFRPCLFLLDLTKKLGTGSPKPSEIYLWRGRQA
jgi:hypothetical protein